MQLTFFLPWFPILLAVGVGGRLLGKQRGYAFGLLCAMFWIILVQAQGNVDWQSPLQLLSMVAGSLAIIAMGGWSGESSLIFKESDHAIAIKSKPFELLPSFAGACRMFEEWLRDHRNDSDPWPSFGEFVRMMLHQTCGATHVRLFRVSKDGTSLEPLHVAAARPSLPAEGVIRKLTAENASHASPQQSASPISQPVGGETTWRFSVQHADQPLGIVQVGSIPADYLKIPGFSDSVAQLTSLLWSLLAAHVRNRTADIEDPVSGLLTRQAFLRQAADSLRDSYDHKEPVAVAVVALERLRELNDAGRWELADVLVHEAANVLRLKARTEDCLGRFDGSRFVILFRRVDAHLASLIVAQIMARLKNLCDDTARWTANITVRCGVVGSGVETPDMRTLVAGALSECHRARGDNRAIASGLEVIHSMATVEAKGSA